MKGTVGGGGLTVVVVVGITVGGMMSVKDAELVIVPFTSVPTILSG
jgi:hypothetical protein